MTTSRRRTVLVAAMSVTVVLTPTVAAAVAVDLAWQVTVDGSAAREWTAALLRLACVGSAGSLVWAAFAAAAGVRDGWRGARTAGATTTAPGAHRAGADPGRPGRPRACAAGSAAVPRTGGVVTVVVASLVVAALTAPSVAAHPGPPSTAVTASAPLEHPDHEAQDPAAPVGAAPVEVPSGSWTALAQAGSTEEAGFLAPRTIDPATAALVTGRPDRDAPSPREVVVHSGDSLWSIAAAQLGPGSDDAEVALAWPRWWQANRDVIGDDPHLLRPGQRLVEPAP